ncbi:MAG: hypothetical protein ABIK83_10495 [Candidatus Zixiibacteriota bacterium]
MCPKRRLCYALAVMAFLMCGSATAWTDVKVNQDTGTDIQNEPSIIVNHYFTGDPLNVLVAYNDIGNTLGVSYSSNGGTAWTDVNLPYVWTNTGDPSVACDPMGDAYACFLSYEGPWFYGVSGIYVCKTTDGGRTWGTPSTVDQLKYVSGAPVRFADKCFMTVDTNMSSPYVGNVYVGWQRDDTNGTNSDVFFSRSTDGGLNFTTPIQINDNPPQTAWAEGAFPFVSADGTVYMTWYDCYFKGGVAGSLWVDISGDGGQTFGTDIKVTNFLAPPLYSSDCTAFKAKCFPSAAADPYDPSKLYITYISDPDGYEDIRIDVGDDPGQAPSDMPVIAREGNYVYVAWQDYRNGFGGSDIYFNRSTDNGKTWGLWSTGPLDNTDTPGANNSFLAKISSLGSNVYVVWEDYRSTGGNADVYFNRSTDYGVTWQTEQHIDGSPTAASSTPVVSSTGNYVYTAWTDTRSGMNDIYFNRSTNGGASWVGVTRIDNGDTPGAFHSVSPRIACTGSYVYCMWIDQRTGNWQPYFNYSTNLGATWQATSYMLNPGTATSTNFGTRGGLMCTGNNVYACWTDDRTGSEQVYFNRSVNSGVSWAGSVQLNDISANCTMPSLDITGSYVYIGWHDDRLAGGWIGDVFFDYSSDFGATWHSDIGPLDPGAIGMWTGGVVVKSEGTNVYASWLDQRMGPGMGAIFFNRSTDNGATWVGETRMNNGTSPFGLQLNMPVMAAGNGWVNVVWPDPRCVYMGMGQQDIFSNYSSDYGATWLSGPDEADVFCVRSTNGGTTWQTPVTVSDNPEARPDVLPWVVVKSNGLVDIAYYQFQSSPMMPPAPASQARMAVSFDAAASFAASVPIQDTEVPPVTKWVGEYIGISVIDTFAFTVFTDLMQTGNSDIFVDRIVNPSVGSYICGDADASGGVDIDDVVYLITYIFAGGPPPVPYAAGEADCSGAIDIDDVVYLIAFIFTGGNFPCDPNGDGIPDC